MQITVAKKPPSPSKSPPAKKPAESKPVPQNLEANLQTIARSPIIRDGMAGIMIRDLATGRIVFEKNADVPLQPASNMKILPVAAAMGLLGPEYEFKTWIYTSGERSNGVLTGDLILKGGGDPFLVPEELWRLARSIADTGLTEVTGDLIADSSFFDQEGIPDADWERITMPIYYNAPTGALSFNFNTITAWLTPTKPGSSIDVRLDPPSQYFNVLNMATTATGKSANTLTIKTSESESGCSLTILGRTSLKSGTQHACRHIKEPDLYTAYSLLDYLQQNGIKVKGKVRRGVADGKAKLLTSQSSRPLCVLMRDAMKHSNNFMIEQTLKTLGAEINSPPGTTNSGAKAVSEYLKSIGIQLDGFEMADGSGLSRNNRVSARQMTDLLFYAAGESLFFPEFLETLPVAGVDGTLRKRLKNDDRNRLVRAKTGLIQNVSCLSGYIDGRKGQGYVFSILLNKTQNRHADAKALQDKIVKALLDSWTAGV